MDKVLYERYKKLYNLRKCIVFLGDLKKLDVKKFTLVKNHLKTFDKLAVSRTNIVTSGRPKYKCMYCNFKFVHHFELKSHVAKVHPEVDKSESDSETDKGEKNLTNSKVSEKTAKVNKEEKVDRNLQKSYKCVVCNFKFPLITLYYEHLTLHDSMCLICLQQFPSVESLDGHMKCHRIINDASVKKKDFVVYNFIPDDNLKYICSTCSMKFADCFQLRRHQLSHENIYVKTTNSVVRYSCAYCHAKFNTPEAAKEHSKRAHISLFAPSSKTLNSTSTPKTATTTPKKKFACSKCYNLFDKEHEVLVHFTKEHAQITHPVPRNPDHDNYTAPMKDDDIDEKSRKLDAKKKINCPLCSSSFDNKAALNSHQSAFHLHTIKSIAISVDKPTASSTIDKETFKNTFSCSVCDEVFKCKTLLNKHMEFHSQLKNSKLNNKKYILVNNKTAVSKTSTEKTYIKVKPLAPATSTITTSTTSVNKKQLKPELSSVLNYTNQQQQLPMPTLYLTNNDAPKEQNQFVVTDLNNCSYLINTVTNKGIPSITVVPQNNPNVNNLAINPQINQIGSQILNNQLVPNQNLNSLQNNMILPSNVCIPNVSNLITQMSSSGHQAIIPQNTIPHTNMTQTSISQNKMVSTLPSNIAQTSISPSNIVQTSKVQTNLAATSISQASSVPKSKIVSKSNIVPNSKIIINNSLQSSGIKVTKSTSTKLPPKITIVSQKGNNRTFQLVPKKTYSNVNKLHVNSSNTIGSNKLSGKITNIRPQERKLNIADKIETKVISSKNLETTALAVKVDSMTVNEPIEITDDDEVLETELNENSKLNTIESADLTNDEMDDTDDSSSSDEGLKIDEDFINDDGNDGDNKDESSEKGFKPKIFLKPLSELLAQPMRSDIKTTLPEKKKNTRRFFDCQDCHLKIRKWSKYQNHLTSYTCTKCDFKTCKMSLMKQHNQENHKGSINCLYCHIEFNSEDELTNHNNEKHYCDICFKGMIANVNSHKLKQSVSCFKCTSFSTCKFAFFKNHLLTSHGISHYCLKCKLSFENKEESENHLKQNHWCKFCNIKCFDEKRHQKTCFGKRSDD